MNRKFFFDDKKTVIDKRMRRTKKCLENVTMCIHIHICYIFKLCLAFFAFEKFYQILDVKISSGNVVKFDDKVSLNSEDVSLI